MAILFHFDFELILTLDLHIDLGSLKDLLALILLKSLMISALWASVRDAIVDYSCGSSIRSVDFHVVHHMAAAMARCW